MGPIRASSNHGKVRPTPRVGAGRSNGVIGARPVAKVDRDGLASPIYQQGAINLKALPPPGLLEKRQSGSRRSAVGDGAVCNTTYPFQGAYSVDIAEKDLVMQPKNAKALRYKEQLLGFSSWSGVNYGKYSTASGKPNLERLIADFNVLGTAVTGYSFNKTSQNQAGFTVQVSGTATLMNTGRRDIKPGQSVVARLPLPGEAGKANGQPGRPVSKVYTVLEPLSPTAILEQIYLAYSTMMNNTVDGIYKTSFCALLPSNSRKNLLTPHQEWALSKKFGTLNATIRGIEALAIRGVVNIMTPYDTALYAFYKAAGQEALETIIPATGAIQGGAAVQNAYAQLTQAQNQRTNVAQGRGMKYTEQSAHGTTQISPIETAPFMYFKNAMNENAAQRELVKNEHAERIMWLASRLGTIGNSMHLNTEMQDDVLTSVLVPYVGDTQLQNLHTTYGPTDLDSKRSLNNREILLSEHRSVSALAPGMELQGQRTASNSVTKRIVGTAISSSSPGTALDMVLGFNFQESM